MAVPLIEALVINVLPGTLPGNIYTGSSITIRHVRPADMAILHGWLKSLEFSFYRPCLGETCPGITDLVERMSTVGQLSPSLEIEVLVEHRPTQTPIGIMSLSGIDHFNRKAEFSIGFVRGLGTRCTMEALHFGLEQAFSVLNLRKLAFYVVVGNSRAQRFMAHWHIAEEGLLREEVLLNSGKTLDLQRYALLRNDWENSGLRRRLQHLVPLVS
ncbi:MAG: GNAT family protein [Methylobacter sp.]|nr:GNAT family protein [Methylobacter sp.]MDP2099752.1 GNAT family protein [Methylobacter sp.]MDP2430386.1 GNAT family protein [Methylobacter sp.]MDP3053554.1 GNAT family protein [Methylobacter sp.]MDP3362733.1 GNAT family protein [Methylobacter sp.]